MIWLTGLPIHPRLSQHVAITRTQPYQFSQTQAPSEQTLAQPFSRFVAFLSAQTPSPTACPTLEVALQKRKHRLFHASSPGTNSRPSVAWRARVCLLYLSIASPSPCHRPYSRLRIPSYTLHARIIAPTADTKLPTILPTLHHQSRAHVHHQHKRAS
jgi:hypothetical protein